MGRHQRLRRFALIVCVLALGPTGAEAQLARGSQGPSATLKVASRGPYYAGEPVDLLVEVVGLPADAEPPTCDAPAISNGVLTFVDMTPSKRSFYSNINGRVSQREDVTYSFRYRLVAAAPGHCDIGAFHVRHPQGSLTTGGGRLTFEQVVEDAALTTLRLVLPEKPVFVGQSVEAILEWTIADAILNDVKEGRFRFHVPLFDLVDRFRFVDLAVEERRTGLPIQTAQGDVVLPYETSESPTRPGTIILRARRTVVPLREGTIDLPATVVTVDHATRYERTLFGRQPSQTRKIAARDLPRRLVVQPIPTAQRPASFAGAIGSGYRLEVSADRTVVQVGDPLKLTLALSGDGPLEAAGAPRLDAPNNLQPQQFRVQSERELGGQIENDVKTFVASVRVLDEALREIPPIEYSWFDPETARFETTHSQPIALRVRRGTVVTADDVVASPASTSATRPAEPAASEDSESGTVARPRFTLTGAELSLEQDPDRLLRRSDGAGGGRAALFGLYCGPLALVLLAWAGRRRAAVDPTVAQRRRRLEEQVRAVETAASLPPREAAARVAHALRIVIAEAPEVRSAELDTLLGAYDAVVYAPASEAPRALAPELRERTVALVRSAVEAVRS